MFSWVNYDGNKYGEYNFPNWANGMGWCITFSSILCIPIVGLGKILKEKGSLATRLSKLMTMSPDWGPKAPLQHPSGEEGSAAVRGMPCNVEGSAMTLLANNSSCLIEGKNFHIKFFLLIPPCQR